MLPKLKLNLTKANVLPLLALAILVVVHFKAPAQMHDAETFVALGLGAFLGFTPPWFVKAEQVLEAAPTKKSPPPLPVLFMGMLFGFLMMFGLPILMVFIVACSGPKVAKTEYGAQLQACIDVAKNRAEADACIQRMQLKWNEAGAPPALVIATDGGDQ